MDNPYHVISGMVAEKKLPSMLYKYRSFDGYTESIFTNNQLWFSSVEEFNDPFDGRIYEKTGYKPEDVKSFFQKMDVEEQNKKPILFYEKKKPGTLQKIAQVARFKNISTCGILSLSKCRSNILMWSHYSKFHTGFVMGFRVIDSPDFFITPYEVQYFKDYPSVNYIKNPIETINTGISAKSIQWEYEEEYRIVKEKNVGLHSFNPIALKEVILGVRTEKENIDRMMRLLSDPKYSHVSIFKASCSKTTYSLNISRLY